MKIIDMNLEGKTVGLLTAGLRSKLKPHLWECVCACGATLNVSAYRLVEGNDVPSM